MSDYDDLRHTLDDTRHLLPSGHGVVGGELHPSSNVMSGVGPEAPTVENELGGKQSLKRWRFDLIHPGAYFVLGRILDYGARKYGEWNWLNISTEDHLNSALMHIYAYLDGNRDDDHLGHAFTRCMFALGVALKDGYNAQQADEK
jgi:hypothetical protein